MNAHIKTLFVDKIITLTFWVSLLLLVLYSFLLVLSFQKLPPLLPIFNQMPWGIPRVGSRVELLIPFALAFGIFFINMIIAIYTYEKLPLVARMLSLICLLATFLAVLFLLRTLIVVLY